MVAEVLIDSKARELNKTFAYQIPEEMQGNVKIGSRVLVPFARMKKLEEGFVIEIKEESEFATKAIAKIEKQSLTVENIELAKWMAKRYFCNLSDCIKLMLPPGTKTKEISNRIKEKKLIFVSLKQEVEEIKKAIQEEKITSEKQKRILRFLIENGETLASDVVFLTETSSAILKTLEKNGYLQKQEKQVQRNPVKHKIVQTMSKLQLTEEQQKAYDEIEEMIEDQMHATFLLFGITGSGKTEIYLQLIEKVLQEGKGSIMLVPEISLTPQMIDRFISRFGQEKIAVLHSKLSLGERYDEWNRIQTGEAKIIIGARSAIFAPIKQLGLILIDEEHDSSYQSEMTPKYDAKEVAKWLAEKNQIPLVLGSATPDIKTYYKAQKEEIALLTLTKRANQSQLPNVEIVDLREELARGNRSMFSESLKEKIQQNLEKKRQTILFLNRRGYSTFIMCRDCGYTAKCKNCNITLTYHQKANQLKCHYCGYETQPMKECPECHSSNIRYFGTGTQKIEEEIHTLYPQASTIRMDVDTVTKKNSHEEILNRFKEEGIDILIGTQMVVKGHHFPNVTLVGVIAADSSLNIEDYRANERTFQLLTQVAGRAGREKLQGEVVIQTYNPDSMAIEFAKQQNYLSFYETEILLRKQLKYPPFCDIIINGITGTKEQSVKQVAQKLYRCIKEKMMKQKIGMLLYQAVPAPIDKINNKYRWRILIKCLYNEQINQLLQEAFEEVYETTKHTDTRISIDINPNNMM